MTQLILKAPPLGLSLQFVTANSIHVDWRELFQDGDEYDVALPVPTYGDVKEHAPDLLDSWIAAPDAFFEYEELQEDCRGVDHRQAFAETDGYHEWADSFQPAMNYAWPVSIAYNGPSVEEAAALINKFAGACTLISFAEGNNPWGDDSDAPEYAIALTGGGMDLSDHLAVAYLCCGCVPPERLLSGLDNFTGPNRSGRLVGCADLLRDAYASTADYFRNRIERLERTLAGLELKAEAE
jgi:hypothetical protein